jgi:putative transposase
MKSIFLAVPDEVWEVVRPLIPAHRRSPNGGRPRIHDRLVFNGIVYRLRTGCQWDAIPKEFGSGTTCYDRFREWVAAGVFEAFHAAMVRYYDQEVGVDLSWCSMDSASVKAPKGGTSRAPIPPIVGSSARSATF